MGLIAFHGKAEVKAFYLKRVQWHYEQDHITKGVYYEEKEGSIKACGVGCTIHSGKHSDYEKELGIPIWLAHVEDRIFEGLPIDEAKKWPAKFLNAITPGQDLDKIKIPFLIFIVESARENFDHKKYPNQLAAIDNVLIELKREPINIEALRAAHSASSASAASSASSAAYYASSASSAAYYASASAAASSASSAAYYASSASSAAYYASAYYASAREKAYSKFAKKLLELISEHNVMAAGVKDE